MRNTQTVIAAISVVFEMVILPSPSSRHKREEPAELEGCVSDLDLSEPAYLGDRQEDILQSCFDATR